MSHDDCLVLLPLVAQAKNNVVNTRNANRISDTLNWEVDISRDFLQTKLKTECVKKFTKVKMSQITRPPA